MHEFLRQHVLYCLLVFWQPREQRTYALKYALVFRFESFWSAFAHYIYQYLPVLALLRPGASPLIVDENRDLLFFETLYLVALKVPCAQSSEVCFRLNGMYCFTVDVPPAVERYVLRALRLTQSSGEPFKLRPPTPSSWTRPTLVTNLNFIEQVAQGRANKAKRNTRRLRSRA